MRTCSRTALLAAPPTSPGARGASVLDSTAKSSSTVATSPENPRTTLVGTPVAHETPVIATGTRPADKSGNRELFKESTTTALVFPNGGVIRLSAAVAPGQLLFLTNQKTSREVVAQVTRKRANPSAGFYIELEFTEPAPDFWGVSFSDGPAVTPADAQQQAAAQIMQSAEPAPDDLSPSAPAPTSAEVQALVDEVEVLRAQLKSMQSQNAAAPAASTDAPPASSYDRPKSSEPAPPLPAMLASVLNPAIAPQKPLTPPEHRDSSSSGPEASHLPGKKQLTPEENLLPQPALDFQHAKAPRASSGDRLGTLRLGLLAAISLFAVFIAAWNMHWLPWLSGKTSPPSPNSNQSARQVTARKPSAPSGATATQQDSNSSLSQSNTATSPSASAALGQPANPTSEATAPNGEEAAAPSVDSSAPPTHKANSAPVVSVSKRSAVHAAPANPDSSSDDNTTIIPPKLLKSVRPVAPSDALRSFVTGNVTLDALIDKSGHVESMKVLTGPPSFHKAAMDALRQYRYEPARQNGKAVPAHVTVTVPFWFEP